MTNIIDYPSDSRRRLAFFAVLLMVRHDIIAGGLVPDAPTFVPTFATFTITSALDLQ